MPPRKKTTTPTVVEEAAPVTEETPTAEAPRRGRKPNLVGQAYATYVKAQKRLERAERKAEKVVDVLDERDAARDDYETAKNAYEAEFASTL